MLYYKRIDIREGIDLTKSNNRKEFMFYNNSCFNQGFKFQEYVCNGCHDLKMLRVNINDIAFIIVKNLDYRCNIHNIDKSEAINFIKRFYS